MDVPIAANILGTIGAVCWSIQLIPQIIINFRKQNTIGLQRSMMLLWACAGVPLGAYNVTGNFNLALQVQPQILTTLSLITWIQCYYYEDKWSRLRCCITIAAVGTLLGGIETALIFALKAAKGDTHWPVTLMGVISTILLSAGLLRHYYDIYVHRAVRGISFIFIGIDAAGDVFSLVSIFFQASLDVLGIVIYATEFILWCGVFACGGYFNFAPWLRRKISQRSTQRSHTPDNSVLQSQTLEGGLSRDVSLHDVAVSSTSVFRTSSSVHSQEMPSEIVDLERSERRS